ncbi:MAG TPA: hypothetical protein VFB67_02785 [Candidatus Polarisedimenticolaceae bacterium]|nr:hypothetical protein [Candidatus Polarisedimenticolaceae bacterium]
MDEILRRWVRERLSRKAGAHLIEGHLERMGDRFARRVADELDAVLDDAIRRAAAFRPGHAFCHRCGKSPCEHSSPPSHRHVFVGYAANGLPRWEDFAQLCLSLRHPEVDRLYDDPPAFVTLVAGEAELNGELLPSFRGTSGYALLGQVAAGFFPARSRDGEGRGVLAVTLQAAASRGASGTRYGLNVLGRTPQGEPLDLLWERHDRIPWRSAVRWAQGALATLERRPAACADSSERRVAGILEGLARRLLRERRARDRRTVHAEERHRGGERPTRQAHEDARVARPDAVMIDERHGTLVVPGLHGRMHFYAADGRLVSSARYTREAIARKRKLGIWREASPSESAGLMTRFADRSGREGTGRSGA